MNIRCWLTLRFEILCNITNTAAAMAGNEDNVEGKEQHYPDCNDYSKPLYKVDEIIFARKCHFGEVVIASGIVRCRNEMSCGRSNLLSMENALNGGIMTFLSSDVRD